MNFRVLAIMSTLLTAVFLQACGGGGSDSVTPASSVSSFPLLAGYKARISAGASDNYTVSGNCAGTAGISSAAATVATFEGIPGYSVTQTDTINFTNCTPASQAVTSTAFYDTSYSPLGNSTPNVEYAKFATAPAGLPSSVKVGDTAVIATLTVYSNSSKATVTGQRVISYVVESDTSTTAIANLITKAYNPSGQLLFVQQSRYRIAADGALTSMSIDVQFSTTSTAHLMYTKS